MMKLAIYMYQVQNRNPFAEGCSLVCVTQIPFIFQACKGCND